MIILAALAGLVIGYFIGHSSGYSQGYKDAKNAYVLPENNIELN